MELDIVVELLFCKDYLETVRRVLRQEKSIFQIMGTFESRINKSSKLSDCLPVAFDQFDGCTIKATYHSTILEFKFIKQEDDEATGYYDFWSYLEAITEGCKRVDIQSKNQ